MQRLQENLKVIQDALHCCLPARCPGGVEIDKARVAAVVKAVEGKTAEEVIAAGSDKLAKFGSAGAAPAAAGGAAAGGQAEKVEEKTVEEEEEVDMGGGMDMFGGDEDY
ncbi:hypothetical protein PI126_g10791 [Phytophthora idaei]|nr:hypothetical protein PI126_g10791 [Phytophthora idaei]